MARMRSAAPTGAAARVSRVAVLASFLLACPSAALAAKTDVVVLKNGDRVTGEVKGVDRARLELSTDTMSSVYIEIEEISEITAQENFEVEDTAGLRHYGALRPAGPRRSSIGARISRAVRAGPISRSPQSLRTASDPFAKPILVGELLHIAPHP